MRLSSCSLALAALAAVVAAAGVRAPQGARVPQGVLDAGFETSSISAPAAAGASPAKVFVVSQNLAQKSNFVTANMGASLKDKALAENCVAADVIVVAVQEATWDKTILSTTVKCPFCESVFDACSLGAAGGNAVAWKALYTATTHRLDANLVGNVATGMMQYL